MSASTHLKVALQSLGPTHALKDGSVGMSGVCLQFVEVPAIVQAFRRMVRELEYDISEMALTTYLCAREAGKAFTALPIFPVRGLQHDAIVQDPARPLRTPRELEGQRVGINRGYTVTSGVWVRGLLQHEYGVHLDRVTWLRSGDEHVSEYVPPPNVHGPSEGQTLQQALALGELAAIVGVRAAPPETVPLIAGASEHALDRLQRDGFYPINHLIVVRDEMLAARPDLARQLLEAFSQSKHSYLQRLQRGAEERDLYAQVWQLTGRDPLPYGIEPNRRMLETLVQYALEQHIIHSRPRLTELFASGTDGWVG